VKTICEQSEPERPKNACPEEYGDDDSMWVAFEILPAKAMNMKAYDILRCDTAARHAMYRQ
jgi:hypothetical protein